MNKWGKQFWVDLAERVGTTAGGSALTLLGLSANHTGHLTPAVGWTILGVPTLTIFVKGLIANLSGTAPTASLVNVDSGPGSNTSVTNPLEK